MRSHQPLDCYTSVSTFMARTPSSRLNIGPTLLQYVAQHAFKSHPRRYPHERRCSTPCTPVFIFVCWSSAFRRRYALRCEMLQQYHWYIAVAQHPFQVATGDTRSHCPVVQPSTWRDPQFAQRTVDSYCRQPHDYAMHFHLCTVPVCSRSDVRLSRG